MECVFYCIFVGMLEKKLLRISMRERKERLTSEEHEKQSERLCRKVLSHTAYARARTLMLFYPLADEIDIRPILKHAFGKKRVLLPVVQGDDLMLSEYQGEKSLTKRGNYGIMEPTEDAFFKTYEQVDLVIVPGVAFTGKGDRMGRGKGYYDRFLPCVPNACKIGVCYDFQVVEQLPVEIHDIKMDEVLTGGL